MKITRKRIQDLSFPIKWYYIANIRIFWDPKAIYDVLLTVALATDRPIIAGNNLAEQKRRPGYCHEFMRACNLRGLLLKLCRHPNRSRFISHQNCDDNAHCLTVLMWQIVTSIHGRTDRRYQSIGCGPHSISCMTAEVYGQLMRHMLLDFWEYQNLLLSFYLVISSRFL
jgi:hypothetical protein